MLRRDNERTHLARLHRGAKGKVRGFPPIEIGVCQWEVGLKPTLTGRLRIYSQQTLLLSRHTALHAVGQVLLRILRLCAAALHFAQDARNDAG